MRFSFITPVVLAVLAGCQAEDATALKIAQEFQAVAERCLLAVRDDGLIYENASSCKALEEKHLAYIDARDLANKAPVEERLTMESGFRMAWGARAMSAAKDSTLSLWVN